MLLGFSWQHIYTMLYTALDIFDSPSTHGKNVFAHILNSVGPVFLLVLVGYLAVKRSLFDSDTIDALMRYAVKFAIPCLLFRAVSTLDLSAAYNWRSMISFYSAAFLCFSFATFIAWRVFNRRPGEAVAVGFVDLFSNLLLIGLPVITMTLGEDALPATYALISLHAPFCYFVGIVSMELLRADGRALSETAVVVTRSIFSNSLMIGIGLGFLVNFSGVPLPDIAATSLDMIGKSALPIALVGLGGVLTRYSLTARIGEIGTVTAISLILHPLLALMFCMLLGVTGMDRTIVVLLASMSPGVNAYLFANMYGRAEGTAAATVLIATSFAVVTVSLWSWLLTAI